MGSVKCLKCFEIIIIITDRQITEREREREREREEALPEVLRNSRGIMLFISGEQENTSLKMKGTGE